MSECKWDPNKHDGKPCPFHGVVGAGSLLGVDLLADKGLKVSLTIPEKKSSYLHGGKVIQSTSDSDHAEIDRRAGVGLFSDLDDSKYNPISINTGLNGSRIIKIERANKKKGFQSLDSKILRDFIENSPDDQEFDLDGTPFKKGEVLDYIKRHTYE